ncbi:MAG TPA: FtsX-like permease family protein [Alphaproteobacteria bacterium]|nr:FtsX-like permease family protein [Alphaproteobacteria bacterium]
MNSLSSPPAKGHGGAGQGDINGVRLALRLARRELRGGLKGFRVFLACLALGVGAIAAVGSLSAAVDSALKGDARALLGGDADLTLSHREASAAEYAALTEAGTVSTVADLRAMTRAADPAEGTGRRILVELKAVDDAYPLYGALELAPPLRPADAFALIDGAWGAVADRDVLAALGLKLGARIKVGEAIFELRAALAREPDRGSAIFILGPRLMVGRASLAATGLIQPGSIVQYHYRVKLPPAVDTRAWLDEISARFPDAGWHARSLYNATPRLQQFLDRIALFLTLVGLTSLLVGGVGIANAVKAYLDGRAATIAILKCLGAPGRLVFRIYLIQMLAISLGGIALGLALGAAVPFLLSGVVAKILPVVAHVGIYPQALALAAAYGLLTTLAFTLWPLAGARDVPAAHLFRNVVAPLRHWPRLGYALALIAAGTALAALTVLSAQDKPVARWFVLGAILTLAAFRLSAWAIAALARQASRMPATMGGRPTLRLALANLHRPGAPTPSVVLSLGVGLTLLVAVGLVEGDISREVREELPQGAPAFYFIDIQPDELAGFDAAVRGVPGAGDIQQVPSLRGRITKINGVEADRARTNPRSAWVLDSDRGLTYAATPPRGTRVVSGKWWPSDYSGEPLVSLDAGVAKDFGLGIGDTLTVNVLGREVTARIASLREIDWSTLGINFVMLFSPGVLDGAPKTYIATAMATPEAEEPILRAVTDRYANITAIRVKDALDAVAEILGKASAAVRLTALFTLIAGTLVLGGAIAAEHKRRTYDAVVLKVLGATRRTLLATFAIEYGVLGAAAAAVAAGIGTLAAFLVVTRVMHGSWLFLPGVVALTILGCSVLTLVLGFAGTWRALGQRPAPLLRNE